MIEIETDEPTETDRTRARVRAAVQRKLGRNRLADEVTVEVLAELARPVQPGEPGYAEESG